MVEDFDDYADLNGGATATTIREAADAPGTHATTMQALVDDLADDSQHIRGNIEGDIQDATTMNLQPSDTAARRLTQSGLFAVGLLNSFADTVETFDNEVEAINTELHANTNARYRAQQNTTPDNSEAGSGDDDSDDLTYAEIKQQEKAKLQQRYNTASTTLETEADRVAGLFEGSPQLSDVKALVLAGYIPLQHAGVWLNLHLTEEETKQAQLATVREMTPEEQVEYVKNTKDIDPAIADVISPEAQEILANDVSDDIKDNSVDADTARIMGLLAAQPAFAHAVYSQVTPEQLSTVINEMSEDAFPMPPTGEDSKEQVALYKNFLTAAGATFATYTKGEGEYAPPSDLQDTWFDAITKDGGNGQAAALTLMLKAGGHVEEYDSEFLSGLTGRVYEWERDHDGDPVWSPLEDTNTPLVDPFRTGDDPSEIRHMASDGLANLLGAMENSPGAAQSFFHDGYPDGDTSKENSRLDYLLTERTFADSAYSDEGDGLGAALEAAAAGNREHTLIPGTDDFADDWSANFTSQLFNTIADKSGDGDGFGPDDVWHIWPDMADNLGAIGASYSSDIYDIVGGAPVPGGPHLQIDLSDLDKVFGEIGRGDKAGIEVLSAGIMLEGNARLDDAIKEWQEAHPGQPIDLESVTEGALGEALRGVGGTSGEILGHIVNKAITVDEHDQSLAATRAAYVSKALDIAGGFIPGAGSVLGEGASELLKSGYDVAKSQGLDLLKNAVAGTPSATGGDYERSERSELSQALENNVASQLIRNGIITVGSGPGQIPASLVTDGPNGSQVLNPDLFDADGPDVIGEENDYTEAERNQMRTDLNRWFNENSSRYVESITQPAQDGLDRELNK